MRSASHHNALSAAIRHVATSPSPACILDGHGAYLFANDAWQRASSGRGRAGDGEPLVGRPFLDGLENDDLRRVWAVALDHVLSGAAQRRVVTGEDNTAAVARLTSTRLEPISARQGVLGLVLVRTTARERPIADVYAVSCRDAAAYEDGDGRVALCPCCRRARDVASTSLWELVPRWVSAPPDSARWITCELCAELHLGCSSGELEPLR